MADRHTLPQRRYCETFNISFGGYNRAYAVTLGYYDGGRLGEVFVSGAKSGEHVEAIARDGAVLLSMALQYGVPLDTIKRAVTRDAQGAPGSIIGAVVDRLTEDEPAVVVAAQAPAE